MLLQNSSIRVNREAWLIETLTPFCSPEKLEHIAFARPEQIVSSTILDKLAKDVVAQHALKASLLSSGTSLLGRASIWLSAPTDVTIYFGNLLAMTQKLAFLYGWDDFFVNGKTTEETYARIMLILGYAFGAVECKEALLETACDALPSVSSEMKGFCITWSNPVVKKAVLAKGLEFSKALLAGALVKRSPLMGCVVAGCWSYYSFKHYAERIRMILCEVMYTRLEEGTIF